MARAPPHHRPPSSIATHNPGKLAEMRDLLAPYGIDAHIGRRTRPAGAGGNRHDVRRQRAHQGGCRGAGVRHCRPSPTIPAWWSMRSTASPASIRRAGPDRTRTFRGAWNRSRRCCSSAARRTPEQRARAFRLRAVRRLAGRPRRGIRRPRRRHARLAAARRQGLRLRSDVPAGRASTAPSAR